MNTTMQRRTGCSVLTVHPSRPPEVMALLDAINLARRPGSDPVTPFQALLTGVLVSPVRDARRPR